MDAITFIPIFKIGALALIVVVIFIFLWKYGRDCYQRGFNDGFKAGCNRWQKEKEEFYQKLKKLVGEDSIIMAKKQGKIKDNG